MNATRYENVFCIFLAGLVVLSRENPVLVLPDLYYLFALLLGLNLAAAVSLRRFPAGAWPAALLTVANNAVVAGIVAKSGGERSLFWVLYLLPVYSGRLLLSERAFWLVAAGGVLFNALPPLLDPDLARHEVVLLAGVRSAVVLLAAAVLAVSMRRERAARASAARQLRAAAELESVLRAKLEKAASRPDGEALDTAGVLHDARTPLTVIQGSVSLAVGEPDPAQMPEHLARIRRAARLCEHILVQALEKLRASGAGVAPASINSLITAAADICEAERRIKGASIRLELGEPMPTVMVDGLAVERVFINLIKNALEALPRGGTVTLATRLLRAPDGSPLAVRATVEDDGPGLPALVLAGRAVGRSGKAAGFGLGVETSRRIVLRHGGSFLAENRPEGGARFVVDIPGGVPAPLASPLAP